MFNYEPSAAQSLESHAAVLLVTPLCDCTLSVFTLQWDGFTAQMLSDACVKRPIV